MKKEVKKGGFFTKSSISVELEDKKIFPPEFIDKNKDTQNFYLGVNFPHGRFRELSIDESYLDKKGDPQQIRGNSLSKDSSTLSHSQSTDKENISISSEDKISIKHEKAILQRHCPANSSDTNSLTHAPSVKPKHKSQQI